MVLFFRPILYAGVIVIDIDIEPVRNLCEADNCIRHTRPNVGSHYHWYCSSKLMS